MYITKLGLVKNIPTVIVPQFATKDLKGDLQ
jgi:hypothetical protein